MIIVKMINLEGQRLNLLYMLIKHNNPFKGMASIKEIQEIQHSFNIVPSHLLTSDSCFSHSL